MSLVDELYRQDRSIDAAIVEEYELLAGNCDRNRKQEARYRVLGVEMERICPPTRKSKLTKAAFKKLRPVMIQRAGAKITLKIYDMAEAAGMTRNELTTMLAELVASRLSKREC